MDQKNEQTISLAQLFLDTVNPRLPEIQASQYDAIRAMVLVQGNRLLALADHLVNNGPNFAQLLIVIPELDEKKGWSRQHLLKEYSTHGTFGGFDS